MWISCWLSAGAGDVGRGWGCLEEEFNNKSRACNCNSFVKRLNETYESKQPLWCVSLNVDSCKKLNSYDLPSCCCNLSMS